MKYRAVFDLNVYIGLYLICTVCEVEYLRSRLFLTFFQCFLCGSTPRSQTEVMPCLQCGNHQWCKCVPNVKKWWGSATWLESWLVTWCLWTNGRIGCTRFLMDQSRKGVFCPLSRKTRRLQKKSIHFREIFEWAFQWCDNFRKHAIVLSVGSHFLAY